MARFWTGCVTSLLLLLRTDGSWGLNCNPMLADTLPGKIQPSGELRAAGYTFTPEYFERINATYFHVCMCSAQKCLRKCCPVGKAYLGKKCTDTDIPLTLNISDDSFHLITPSPVGEFHLVIGNTCVEGKYKLEPDASKDDEYFIKRNGHLWLPNMKSGYQDYDLEDFCVEDSLDEGGDVVGETILVCFRTEVEVSNAVYPIGMIISIPFLLITLLVYAFLPDLQNVHGKSLMCHVSSMIVGYVFLVTVQLWGKSVHHDFCVAAAYIIQFSFLATFFWLNVMSFDIWWTFSGFGGLRGQRRRRERVKFLLYCAYAWGGPLIMLSVSLALDLSPNVPDYVITPMMGYKRCWFATFTATLAYFYGPVAVILICNIGLFAGTAYKIFVVKQETRVLTAEDNRSTTTEANKQRFFLYLKLFLVMGVNWVMEVVSWAAGGPSELWLVTDICNTLQGVLICWMFVGSSNTRSLIIARIRNSQSSASPRTTGTSLSNRFSRTS